MTADSGTEFYWRAVLGGDLPPARIAPPDHWRGLAFHLSPGLLQSLLREREIDPPAGLAAAAESAALLQRFTATAQREWLGRLAAAGFTPVVLKGFGIARRYYGGAAVWRRSGDLDLLFEPHELDRARVWLTSQGFAHQRVDEKPWGALHATSEAPLVAPDGSVTFDLHSEADAPPLPRGLPRVTLVASAIEAEEDGIRYRMPSPEHGLLITLSNAAKDKFGPYAVRRGVDVARILALEGEALAFGDVERALRAARLWRPSRYFLQLLIELGLPASLVPPGFAERPRGIRASAFDELLRDWRAAASDPPARGTLAAREWLLSAGPTTALGYNLRRIAGLARRRLAKET